MIKIGDVYSQIVKGIVDELVLNGIIKESDSAIYSFGLHEGGIFIFNVLLTLVIASFMQDLWVGIMFFLSFVPVRRFAGGFHAATRSQCFVFSILIIVSAMKGIALLYTCRVLCVILILGICSIVIGMMSPIANGKRELSIVEQKKYKKTLLLILFCEFAFCIVLGHLKQKLALACVTMAIIVCLFLNILEVVKNIILVE